MKIGIFVHSKTGNTFLVAQKLQEKLNACGHEASILRITAKNDDESDFRKVILDGKPSPSPFEVLILGAPVRGFSLSAAMKAYLSDVESLDGKRVACYLTQFFPYRWMGGNSAMSQFLKACQGKGARIYGTGIINWSNGTKREKQLASVVETLSAL